MCKKKKDISTFLVSNKKFSSSVFSHVSFTELIPSFKNLGIDCVFTGTSHPSSSDYFEVNCIKTAVKEGIYTISFIDHWVNFKLRFDELDVSEYPDEIWVVDEEAKKLAIAEGLPEKRIAVKQNPYHYFLKHEWKSKYSNKDYLKSFQIPAFGTYIMFAPDPLSLRNGKKNVGFTEDEALEDILSFLSELGKEVCLVIKCHPLQNADVLKQVIEESRHENCFLIEEADAAELIHAADVVVGFYSNLLLEAEALNKKVIRYFPGNEEADILRHKIGLKKVRTKKELLEELKHCIYE
jgi:CDP-glycerol glycerophosphotransferase (TagB/SpsB family)